MKKPVNDRRSGFRPIFANETTAFGAEKLGTEIVKRQETDMLDLSSQMIDKNKFKS